jgi:glutathione S-transferase
MKLYFSPGACSFVPHSCLHQVQERTGQAFESQAVNLKEGGQRTPDFLALNPRAQVPVLQEGQNTLSQVAAICAYLHEKFPAAQLFSADPWARAQQMSGLIWMNNTVHPTFTRIFRSERFVDGDASIAALKAFSTQMFVGYLAEINAMTAKAAPFLYGNSFSPADAYALMFIRWGANIGLDPEANPAYWAYAQRLSDYSPVKQTIAKEGIIINTFKKA